VIQAAPGVAGHGQQAEPPHRELRLLGREQRSPPNSNRAAQPSSLTTVSSLRDGKIVRIRNCPDKAEALEAVGLRE
jgi:hypothetical protein